MNTPVTISTDQLEQIEIDLLLETIVRRYGHDFRGYASASVARRLKQFLPQSDCTSISAMIPRLLHDEAFFSRLFHCFSIPVTEMFRDPPVYRALREQVIPFLKTWPHIKIWHAGCATGEEAYSLAILLMEEGLYERSTIYATDFNERALEHAREGIYRAEQLQLATQNYQAAGGTRSFAEYYHTQYGSGLIDPALRRRVLFANHNLVSDGVFGEMHLILCRNVLIYFNETLKNQVLGRLTESLVHGGFLCLGSQENLQFSAVQEQYDTLDGKAKLYTRKSGTPLHHHPRTVKRETFSS